MHVTGFQIGPTNRVQIEEEEVQIEREAGHLGRRLERKKSQGSQSHRAIYHKVSTLHEEQTPFLFFSFFFPFSFCLLEMQGHMDVPRLGVKME